MTSNLRKGFSLIIGGDANVASLRGGLVHEMLGVAMDVPLTISDIEKYAVVEFRTPSLMDPAMLEIIGQAIYKLVDEQDRRMLVLDFEQVEYLSSQAIGIVLTLNKKLAKLKHTSLVLCGVGPKLMELIKITRLDKVLKIKSSQKEAVKVLPN